MIGTSKWKETHPSLSEQKHTIPGTLIQSHTSGDRHTHCQVPHTLSNLKQPRCKKAAAEKGREKSQTNFQSSLFQEKEERGSIASRNCSWPEVLLWLHAHTHTLAAPFGASKTSINAQSKIYSSEKQQPKAFQGRQLGCRASGLTEKVCRLQLGLLSTAQLVKWLWLHTQSTLLLMWEPRMSLCK